MEFVSHVVNKRSYSGNNKKKVMVFIIQQTQIQDTSKTERRRENEEKVHKCREKAAETIINFVEVQIQMEDQQDQ